MLSFFKIKLSFILLVFALTTCNIEDAGSPMDTLRDPRAGTLEQDKIAHFKFDGNYEDSVEYTVAGVAYGEMGTLPEFVPGVNNNGKALYLDTTNEADPANPLSKTVNLGNRPEFNINIMTLTFWAKIESPQGPAPVIEKRLWHNAGFRIMLQSTQLSLMLHGFVLNEGDQQYYPVGNAGDLPIGNWYHFTITINLEKGVFGTLFIYIRNPLVYYEYEIPCTKLLMGIPVNQPLLIGDGWSGYIDDLQIYNRALTADEREFIYNSLTK